MGILPGGPSLPSQVGYGKTAAVLALVALTRDQPSPPTPQTEKLLKSKATLVMLPANLCLGGARVAGKLGRVGCQGGGLVPG